MDKEIFTAEYKKIQALVRNEFLTLDRYFEDYFSSHTLNERDRKNQIIPILKEFLSLKGKRIRSLIIFLLTKAMNCEISDSHYRLALADELLHNATLIHDDIVDCSVYRRGQKTLNFDYDSKLAVLAGDYLLCEVLKLLTFFEDERIRKIHSTALSQMINGELNQYFNRFKIGTIEEYIEKSKAKTARLFEAGALSGAYLCGCDAEKTEKIGYFALNFGIAFQIQNDVQNFEKPEKLNEDIENGDYSAPLIYFAKEKYGEDAESLHNIKQTVKKLKNSSAIEKTKELAQFYIKQAIENLSFLEDNSYKQALIDLCNLLKD